MPFACPLCDAKTRVKETRSEVRQRVCIGCGHQFFTHETELDDSVDVILIKPRERKPRNQAKQKPKRKLWSKAQIDRLTQGYLSGENLRDVARSIGRSQLATMVKAKRLGLSR